MTWFKKNAPQEEPKPPKDPTPEIEAHKRATKRKVNEARKASEELNKQLKENHFTFQIYLAAGGKR